MQLRSAKLLEDIRDSSAFILETTAALDNEAFRNNRLVRQAVERNFQIIGEALRRLAQHDAPTAAALGNVARIIAFRDIIVHGYDSMDFDVVWAVVKHDVPRLMEQVVRQLRDAAPGD